MPSTPRGKPKLTPIQRYARGIVRREPGDQMVEAASRKRKALGERHVREQHMANLVSNYADLRANRERVYYYRESTESSPPALRRIQKDPVYAAISSAIIMSAYPYASTPKKKFALSTILRRFERRGIKEGEYRRLAKRFSVKLPAETESG